MNEQFNEWNNENNENKKEMFMEEGIQALAKPRTKRKNGKGIALTLAVALASFGAGSLYTSHTWIAQASQNATTQNHPSTIVNTLPENNVSQTSTHKTDSGMSVAEVASLASSSVVEITTETVSTDMFMRQYVTQGAGSGVIISEDGYIATNNHVINGASKIIVRLTTGEEYEAELIGTDSQTDVAVVKVKDAKNLKAVTFGNSDNLVVGDTAIAIGNPLGKLGGTVTDGIISALDREIELESQKMTLLQTNAAINPGNSGGGLFNNQGQLIGLVVAKSAGSDVEGLGFAIPSNVVQDVVKSIIDVGYVQGRPVLGVAVVDISSAQLAYQYGVNQLGVFVAQLTEGTKAEASGLKVGDCLVAVDDTQISSTTDLKAVLQEHQVGEKVKVIVSRDGKLVTLNVELSENVPTKSTEKKTVIPSEN